MVDKLSAIRKSDKVMQIILKSGYEINVNKSVNLKNLYKEIFYKKGDFVTVGNSAIRIDDISAVLVGEEETTSGY